MTTFLQWLPAGHAARTETIPNLTQRIAAEVRVSGVRTTTPQRREFAAAVVWMNDAAVPKDVGILSALAGPQRFILKKSVAACRAWRATVGPNAAEMAAAAAAAAAAGAAAAAAAAAGVAAAAAAQVNQVQVAQQSPLQQIVGGAGVAGPLLTAAEQLAVAAHLAVGHGGAAGAAWVPSPVERRLTDAIGNPWWIPNAEVVGAMRPVMVESVEYAHHNSLHPYVLGPKERPGASA